MAAASASGSFVEDPDLVPSIQSALDAAERIMLSSEVEKVRVKNLRGILYDVEDALQDLRSRELQDLIEAPSGSPACTPDACRCRIPCYGATFLKRRRAIEDFEKLKSQQEDLTFGPTARRSAPVGGEGAGPRVSSGCIPSQREEHLCGIKDVKETIVNLLTTTEGLEPYVLEELKGPECRSNLIILPVAGVVGIGKTTLFQHIYNDGRIKRHFELRMWICTSNGKDRDPTSLLSSALECVGDTGASCSDIARRLRAKLETAKHPLLLVLDDACNSSTEFWSEFLDPFARSAAKGSVVVITTRDHHVVYSLPRNIQRTESFVLPPLEFEDSWSLFQLVVGSSMLQDRELSKIGREIVCKCQGIPLNIKCAGSKLRSVLDPAMWREVLERASYDSYWNNYFAFEGPLKRCFLYCALFPEGYSFSKYYLIKLWIQEGFVEEGKGDEHFTKLLYSHFLHHSWDSDGFVMPNPVRNLAESILNPYLRRVNDPEYAFPSVQHPGERVRHLSYIVQDGDDEIDLQLEGTEKLRTLLVVQTKKQMPHVKLLDNGFSNMGCLRTLDLSYTAISVLPDSVGYLRSLSFLGLNGTPIEFLPDSLCTLYNLQILELSPCMKLRRLPKDIRKLTRLKHLSLDPKFTSFCLPAGISRLTNLHTLSIFKVGERGEGNSGIEELEKLENLQGELCLRGLYNVGVEDSKLARLDGKELLRYLTLCWSRLDGPDKQGGSSSDSKDVDAIWERKQVLDNLKPHINIELLKIESYAGKKFPEWMGDRSFQKLKFIYLRNCTYVDVLPSLGGLPSLENLIINCEMVEKIDRSFCGTGSGFAALRKLFFAGMKEWKEWSDVHDNDFPKLQKLKLSLCPHLMEIPQINAMKSLKMTKCNNITSIPCLPLLEKLKIDNCGKITHVPVFPLLTRFEISYCAELIAIPSLPRLETLKIKYCSKMSQLYLLFSVKELIIWHCNELMEIPSLPSLQSMQMFNCRKVMTLPAFPFLEKLEIQNCKELEGFPSLTCLKALKIANCGKMSFLPELTCLKVLELHKCEELEVFPSLTSQNHGKVAHFPLFTCLQELKIHNCRKLLVIPHLASLQKLHLSSYRTSISWEEWQESDNDDSSRLNLSSLPQITSLTSLNFENCDGLCELPTFESLTSLTLMCCDRLETIHNQPNLQDLWVECCNKFNYNQVKDMLASLDNLFMANCNGDISDTVLLCQKRSLTNNEYTLSFEKDTGNEG